MQAANYSGSAACSEAAIREMNLFRNGRMHEMNGCTRQLRDACNHELEFLERIDKDGHLYYDQQFLDIAIKVISWNMPEGKGTQNYV